MGSNEGLVVGKRRAGGKGAKHGWVGEQKLRMK